MQAVTVQYSTTWHVVTITALEKCIQMFLFYFCFIFKALGGKREEIGVFSLLLIFLLLYLAFNI